MLKVFRPFWSYDVQKTEEWLSAMAENGYFFVKLNRMTRFFFFQKGEPKLVIYRITYDKTSAVSLPNSLLIEGWTKVIQRGNWYVISNEKPHKEIKTSSVREGIIKRNRLIMYAFIGVLIYLSSIIIINLGIMGLTWFNDIPVEVEESPLWIIAYTMLGVVIGIIVLAIYSVIKINRTNKNLLLEKPRKFQSGENSLAGRYGREKEKQLKRSGQMVVKRKLAWMYAPDKLEKWLETMEEKGLNLYRVSRTGTTFYFMEGKSRKVSYCADYQNISDERYFDFHRDAGWKSVFLSYSALQKWTIWGREYTDGEEKPQLYSDKSHLLKHAGRIAIAYTILFSPLVIMYLLNIGMFFDLSLNNNPTKLSVTNMVMFAISIFIFGSFIVRTWLYYMRIKRFN